MTHLAGSFLCGNTANKTIKIKASSKLEAVYHFCHNNDGTDSGAAHSSAPDTGHKALINDYWWPRKRERESRIESESERWKGFKYIISGVQTEICNISFPDLSKYHHGTSGLSLSFYCLQGLITSTHNIWVSNKTEDILCQDYHSSVMLSEHIS